MRKRVILGRGTGRRRPRDARLLVLVLSALAITMVCPSAVATSPVALPTAPHLADELALVERSWSVLDQNDTTVTLEGRPVADHPGDQTIIGYRIHGDIAAIEGTLVLETPSGTARPVYNTGVRYDRVRFDPPLTLADGAMLSEVFPAALDWIYRGEAMPPGTESLSYHFAAEVPDPRDGRSPPPRNVSAASDPAPGIELGWSIRFHDRPVTHEELHYASPANALLEHSLVVQRDAVDETTWQRIDRTNVTHVYRLDFGGGRQVAVIDGPVPLQTNGTYVGNQSQPATYRFLDKRTAPSLMVRGPDGGVPSSTGDQVFLPPMTIEAVAPWEPLLGSPNGTTVGRVAWLYSEFGYLMDLPDPASTEPPAGGRPNDVPAPAGAVFGLMMVGLVMAASVAARRRR